MRVRTEAMSVLESQVRSNIAAIHLERAEFGPVLVECRQALRLWSGNVRACQRAAKASVELGRAEDAMGYCDLALALEPGNKVRTIIVPSRPWQLLGRPHSVSASAIDGVACSVCWSGGIGDISDDT